MDPEQGHDKLLALSSGTDEPHGELRSGTHKQLQRKLGVWECVGYVHPYITWPGPFFLTRH